jgi:hypothetical protein
MEKRIDHVNLLSGNMKKLDEINMTLGLIVPPSTTGAQIRTFDLSIRLLSLSDVYIPSPLDPSSLPLVRSLHLSHQACRPIQLLLPQLDSLHVHSVPHIADTNPLIQGSTSITSLALNETLTTGLDDGSKTVIKERIVELRLIVLAYGSDYSTLVSMIDGSKAIKKVILDGIQLGRGEETGFTFLQTLRFIQTACKKKEIELWKVNFEVGNGKVDLEK